jgi:hypothetical protein
MKKQEQMSSVFKVGFDIHNYKDIIPDVHEYRKIDEVINMEIVDIDDHIWRIDEPKVITQEYIQQEVRRVLRSGCWFFCKGHPIWLPPNYYFFLRYFNVGGKRPDFRINRLMSVYEQLRVRNNPRGLGTLTVKSRQIGETSFEMSNLLWESIIMDFGMLGCQSKTLKTAKESCWRTLIAGWYGIPKWIKPYLFPDFKSKDQLASTMKFFREAPDTDSDGNSDKVDIGKDVLITYAAGSHNAFDSINNCRSLKLDEWLKWEEASPYATFLNYRKFMAVGTVRKGLFSIFSSPADMETRYIKETYDFWIGSDPAKLNPEGTTDTGIFRIHTSPLSGIEGFYDKFGDADANEIYDHIMTERKRVPKEYRMAEVRAYPLSEEEIFGSFDNGKHSWSNQKGIIERKTFVINHRFKDEETKEPAKLYGNLIWRDGAIDTDVDFRIADRDSFDLEEARFCITDLHLNKETLRYNSDRKPLPPILKQSCLGIDPINARHAIQGTKGFSNAAMLNWVFADIMRVGRKKYPSLIYCCRPSHAEIFYEDSIKAAVFTRSMVEVENINSKVIDYFEDRGYFDWLLAKRGQPKNSKIKGDAPSGRGGFLEEMILLIDSATNTPLNETDPYHLDNFWFWELLEDLVKFNPLNTQENDLTMAFGLALIGSIKILGDTSKKPSRINDAVLDFLLN